MSASDPSAPGLPLAGGGGASLPTTPGLALLDAGAASRVVVLNVSGEGDTESYDTVATTGLASMLGGEAAGTAVISDGAGDIALTSADVGAMLAAADDAAIRTAIGAAAIPTAGVDSARPSASLTLLGALYTATDTGVRYVCESDGLPAGGARWAVQGARGQEGRDTTAVQAAATVYGTSSVTINTATIQSWAIVFSQRSIPVATQVLATIDTGAGAGIELADIGRQSGDRYLLSVFRPGSWTGGQALTGATISGSPTTTHCLAVTIDGQLTRYSLDGAAAQTVDHGAGTATNGTAALRLCAGSTGANQADAWMTAITVWSTAVGDSDLAVVSAAGAAGGASPGRIPAVSGATEILRYHASSERTGVATSGAIGTLGGSLTWTAAPTLVIR